MPPLAQRVLLALTVFTAALLGLAASTGAFADVAPSTQTRPRPTDVQWTSLLGPPTIPEAARPPAPDPAHPDTTIPEVGQPPLWVRPQPSPLQQVLPVEDPVPY